MIVGALLLGIAGCTSAPDGGDLPPAAGATRTETVTPEKLAGLLGKGWTLSTAAVRAGPQPADQLRTRGWLVVRGRLPAGGEQSGPEGGTAAKDLPAVPDGRG